MFYCAILHCIVLSCTVLHRIALHYAVLQYIALHSLALYCTALLCIALYCIGLYIHTIPLIGAYGDLIRDSDTNDQFQITRGHVTLSEWRSYVQRFHVPPSRPCNGSKKVTGTLWITATRQKFYSTSDRGKTDLNRPCRKTRKSLQHKARLLVMTRRVKLTNKGKEDVTETQQQSP